jgi:hypothetical protein
MSTNPWLDGYEQGLLLVHAAYVKLEPIRVDQVSQIWRSLGGQPHNMYYVLIEIDLLHFFIRSFMSFKWLILTPTQITCLYLLYLPVLMIVSTQLLCCCWFIFNQISFFLFGFSIYTSPSS